MAGKLQLALLGKLEITQDGEPVPGLHSAKAQALLCYLAVTGRPHFRPVLTGLLWGDLAETNARANLRRELSSLRQAVGDHLVITRQEVAFDRKVPYWLDVEQFESGATHQGKGSSHLDDVERLREVVDLYRGDFLEGFYLREAPAFEEWVVVHQTRLRELALQALHRLSAHYAAQGEAGLMRGINYTQRLLTLEPSREEAHRALMRLLALSGQRGAALAQYEACRQALAEDLGVEPGPETRALYERIRSGELAGEGALLLESVSTPQQALGACPYQGLKAFREVDAPFFFGRETFTARLCQAVHAPPVMTAVVGSSGSGKSSVVYAGLLPRLQSTGEWLTIALRPGSQPFHALAGTLLPVLEPELTETDRLIENRKLAHALLEREILLYDVLARILAKRAEAQHLLLLLDQFEELYTLCPEPEVRRCFVDTLLGLVEAVDERGGAPLALVLTLRADFMGQALAHRPFADVLQEGALLLGPMTREELRAAIERPAEQQGAALETGLVERLLDDVGEGPGYLPLLEFALTLLWERLEDGRMTHVAYEAIGRVDGALTHYADEVYAALQADAQERAHRVFLQLVQPGEGTEDTRRVALRADLGAADANWELVQHLADQRLVVTGQDAVGNQTVEVVHEALIQRWGRLRAWMEEDRAFRTWQERLRAALRAWQASDQDEGALLRGVPLAEAEGWLVERGAELSAGETVYIQASVALRQRQQAERERRRGRTILALTSGLVIAVVLAAVALIARQQAEAAEEKALRQASIGLGSQALVELQGAFPERSVLLALEAVEHYPYTWQAERALGQAVLGNRMRAVLPHPGQMNIARWSPGGDIILTASVDGTIKLRNALTGKELLSYDNRSMVMSAEWLDNGDRLLTLTFIGEAREWDISALRKALRSQPGAAVDPGLATSEVRFRNTTNDWIAAMWSPSGDRIVAFAETGNRAYVTDGLTGEVLYTISGAMLQNRSPRAWSPSGERIASCSHTDGVKLWDAASGDLLLTLSDHSRDVGTVAWSPDGARLVTGGPDGQVRVWKAATGAELLSFSGHEGDVTSAAWSPDGRQFVTSGTDGRARVWDAATGAELHTLFGHVGTIGDADWSPSGEQIVTAGKNGKAIVWDVEGALLTLPGPGNYVNAVAWSPTGEQIASGFLDRAVKVWDVSTGEAVLTLNHEGNIFDVAWSPEGERLLTASALIFTNTPGTVKVWQLASSSAGDATSGEELLEFSRHTGWGVTGAAWSPDGSEVVSTGREGTAQVWDAVTGKPRLTLRESFAMSGAAWSPDGQRIVTSNYDGAITVWDAVTGSVIREYRPESEWESVAWSLDGREIVAGAYTALVHMWDADTGTELRVLTGHGGVVAGLDWSPAGDRLLTSSFDGTARVWDMETGVELVRYDVGGYTFAAWSPDGTRIAISSGKGTLQVFPAWQTLEELIAYAKECCVFRELTAEERAQFGLPAR
jgi:WD40 repeat protein/DNA-binding SARP family transcriptional activator